MCDKPPTDDEMMTPALRQAMDLVDTIFAETDLSKEREVRGFVDRSGWGAGGWDDEPDSVMWLAEAPPHYRCQAFRSPWLGHWCGYVGVPPGHPLHGVADYSDPRVRELDVHGGVTHSYGREGYLWAIGFHCANVRDVQPGFEARLASLRLTRSVSSCYKPLAFVRAEVESLARQLARIAEGATP